MPIVFYLKNDEFYSYKGLEKDFPKIFNEGKFEYCENSYIGEYEDIKIEIKYGTIRIKNHSIEIFDNMFYVIYVFKDHILITHINFFKNNHANSRKKKKSDIRLKYPQEVNWKINL